MFAGYYARPRDVDEVIELVGLTEKTGARVKTLSGGQKRRLDLGIALVGDPERSSSSTSRRRGSILRAADRVELVRSLRSLGKTIVLRRTTSTRRAAGRSRRGDPFGSIVRIGTLSELIGVAPNVEIRYREASEIVVSTDEPTRARGAHRPGGRGGPRASRRSRAASDPRGRLPDLVDGDDP